MHLVADRIEFRLIVAAGIGLRACVCSGSDHKRARLIRGIGRDDVLKNHVCGGVEGIAGVAHRDRVPQLIPGDHLPAVEIRHRLLDRHFRRIEFDVGRDHARIVLVLRARQSHLRARGTVGDDVGRGDEIGIEAELIEIVGGLRRDGDAPIRDRAVEEVVGRIRRVRELRLSLAPLQEGAVACDAEIPLVGHETERGVHVAAGWCNEAGKRDGHIPIRRRVVADGRKSVEDGEISGHLARRLVSHDQRPAGEVVDVPRIAPHVGHRVGAGAGRLHEARDILEGAVGLHVGRQIGDATDHLADHGPRDVGIAGIPGPLEFDRLQHAVADVGIRPGSPVEPGEEHVGARGQHELCGAGIKRRGVAVDVDVGHVPIVIVEIRPDAVSCVDRGLRVAGRGHQRVRGKGDVADGVGGVGNREWRHHRQGQPILQPLGLLQIAEPVATSRNGPALRQFLPGLHSPRKKRVENVHGAAPGWLSLSAQRCSAMPKNKKSRRERTPVCSLAPALALQNRPASAGMFPQLVFRHIDCLCDRGDRLRHLHARLRQPRQWIGTLAAMLRTSHPEDFQKPRARAAGPWSFPRIGSLGHAGRRVPTDPFMDECLFRSRSGLGPKRIGNWSSADHESASASGPLDFQGPARD